VTGRATVAEREAQPATVNPERLPPHSPPSSALLALPLALVTLGLTYWTVDIVSPALPDIQGSLDLTGAGAGLVFAAFFGGRLVTNLPAAMLVNRHGPRWTAAIGAILLTAGSLVAAVASGPLTLLPARGVQGVGVACLATAGLLSVLRARPGRGAAMTAFNLAAGLGGSAGLISGGLLAGAVGWRGVFGLSAVIGAVVLAGAVLSRERARPAVATDDAVTDGDSDGVTTGRRALGIALAANLLVYVNYSIWVVSLPLFAAERFHADARRIGSLLLLVNVVHLSAAIPAGRVIRHIGPSVSLAGGFGLTALGLAGVLIVPSEGWLLGPIMLYAVGQVTGSSAAGDLLLRRAGGGGRAVGFVRFTSDVGLVAGPAGVGALADVAGVAAPFATLATGAMMAAVITWYGATRHRH